MASVTRCCAWSEKRCASVCASRWQPLDVLVVDNASRQPVLAEVARRHPGVRTIANPSNLGYAGGNNAGVAKGPGGDVYAGADGNA